DETYKATSVTEIRSNDDVYVERVDTLNDLGEVVDTEYRVEIPGAVITAERVGTIFGSTIGRRLAGDNPFAQIAVGTVLGSIGSSVGEVIDNLVWLEDLSLGDAIEEAFQNFGPDVAAAGLGAVTSYLVGEAIS
ncbi:MAG: hypothetical protein CUN54_10245, partial [Phototrophicales bacterium]